MIRPASDALPPVLVLTSDTRGWETHPSNISANAVATLLREVRSLGVRIEHIQVAPDTIHQQLAAYSPATYLILNWCEGWGNNNFDYTTPTSILEELGYTFTGSDSATLWKEQHKDVARSLLRAAHVSIAPSRIVESVPVQDWHIFPAIVKPSTVHSSEGISRHSVVDTAAELDAQVAATMTRFSGPVIIEEFLTGIEYHVGVWGNGATITTLPISAIDYSGIADYHEQLCTEVAKWQFDDAIYQTLWHSANGWHFPTNIPPDINQQLQHNAVAAYDALGLRDYARLDLRVHRGTAYVIDINANPGIDFDGKLAIMSTHAGYSYGQFITQILAFAWARHPHA
jgi:D-alanine-D-alanine ligase